MSATCKDLARMALAFAITSTMLSLPYRSPQTWAVCEHGFTHGYARESASSPQALYVSTASEMHCQPSSEHFVSFVYVCLILQLLQLHQQKPPLRKQYILGLSGEGTMSSAGLVLSSSLPKPHPVSRQAGNEAIDLH